MKNRYQLVLPYHSSQVHEGSSLKSGSIKCYKELKKSSYMRGAKEFSVMDMDNFKVYSYAIGIHTLKGGDQDDTNLLPVAQPNGQTNGQLNVQPDNSQLIQQPQQPQQLQQPDDLMSKLSVIESKIDMLLNECKSTASHVNNMETNTRIYEENMEKLRMFKMLEKEKQEDLCTLM